MRRDCHVISMANGELQGYLASKEAVRQAVVRSDELVVRQPGSRGMAGQARPWNCSKAKRLDCRDR